jgi:hypothetical protein
MKTDLRLSETIVTLIIRQILHLSYDHTTLIIKTDLRLSEIIFYTDNEDRFTSELETIVTLIIKTDLRLSEIIVTLIIRTDLRLE